MSNATPVIDTILKALAIGMGVASLVLGGMGVVDERTILFFLSVGLTALAVAALAPRR